MKKVLVTYFSASGVTSETAKKISEIAGAQLYEIKPETPYTKKDLNWLNPLSRTTKEMHKKSFRPPLADKNAPISDYDTVLIGFPIWWYVAPTIINTFLESYDFSNKKIILFATSGGSGFGKTVSGLKVSLPDSAEIIEGKLLNKADDAEITEFLKEQNII